MIIIPITMLGWFMMVIPVALGWFMMVIPVALGWLFIPISMMLVWRMIMIPCMLGRMMGPVALGAYDPFDISHDSLLI